jgi:hypothetical protein
MSAERQVAVTDADIRSLAAKLKGLHALLTPPEQEVLHTLLRRAAAREDADRAPDTEGFLWGVSFNPFAYLDGIDFNALEEQGVRRRTAARRIRRRRTTTSDAERRSK